MLDFEKIYRALERYRKSPEYIHPIIREYRERVQNDALSKMVRNKVMEIKMNKDELLQQIKNTEESIKELNSKMDKLKEELNKPENSRWKPTENEEYLFVDSCGVISRSIWFNDNYDNFRYNTRNCFKTEVEAEAKLEYIKTHYELMDIADELNDGEKIEWFDGQFKYYLVFDNFNGEINFITAKYSKGSQIVYCLSDNFKDVALEKIGEERLKAYLTYSEQ